MNEKISQIKLPNPDDIDQSRLLLDGEGIHAGDTFEALFPDGWHTVRLEVRDGCTGPACWYIATTGYGDISPVGLFVKK